MEVVRVNTTASWQSGDAEACKALYSGSIPLLASNDYAGSNKQLTAALAVYRLRRFKNNPHLARVAELVDARDLKSLALTGVPVRFRPRAPSHIQ